MKNVYPLSLRLTGRPRDYSRGILAFIVVVGLGIGGSLVYFMIVSPYLQANEARDWVEVPCTILSSEVESHDSGDSITYSPHIVYRYTYEGKEYTSERYDFRGGSSSFYDRHAEVVRSYPSGSETVCWIDPENPSEAVLNRDFGLGELWPFLILMGILVLIFLLFVFRWKTPKEKVWLPETYSRLKTRRITRETSFGNLQPLAQEYTFLQQLVGIVLVAAFWNGIVYMIFLYDSGFRGVTNNPMNLIGFSIFGGIGLVLILAGVLWLVTGLFFKSPKVLGNDSVLRLGDPMQIGWSFPQGWNPLTKLQVRLICAESVNKSEGENVKESESILWENLVVSTENSRQNWTGNREIEIPEDVMHSFEFGDKKVKWLVRMEGKQLGFLPYKSDHPIVILPKEWRRDWKRA
ncbi:MAG: DUF3592 domain-containing protein [Candidatus Omnitrophica bacterium]|nr:DUF3592 domain-containing protein [Candidatus Omnitrophota bacterium]